MNMPKKYPTPSRRTLENRAARLGLELDRAGYFEKLHMRHDADMPGKVRWVISRRLRGGLSECVRTLGTLRDVARYLDEREIMAAYD